MPTNLAIDDRLIEHAKVLGHHRSKKEAVTTALEEYIQRLEQRAVIELFGKIHYAPGYSHKRQRRRS